MALQLDRPPAQGRKSLGIAERSQQRETAFQGAPASVFRLGSNRNFPAGDHPVALGSLG
jgi:hypothetical protein